MQRFQEVWMIIGRIQNTVESLEGKIDHLLEIFDSLKLKNRELQTRVDKLEQELQDKTEAENRQAEQREIIQNKIESLLIKLKDFSELV